jgi:hypothetical protein
MKYRSILARRTTRLVAIALLYLSAAHSPTLAQELSGRVELGGSGVEGQEVVLHRVARDTAGVVATSSSTADGRFSVTLPPVDTTGFTVFFATVDYQGVRYFGPPVHPGQSYDDYPIVVFDTVGAGAADAPALRLVRRDIVMLPESGGGWEVNEVVQLLNPGERTLVSRNGGATWEFPIPSGAEAFEIGEGEIAASELVRIGDRAHLLVPLLPGPREVFVRYRIPAAHRELRIPVGTPADSLKVFVQLPSPEVRVSGLDARPTVQTEAGDFLSFAAADLGAENIVTVAWTGPRAPPVSPTAAALLILAVLLIVGTFAAIRQRPRDHADRRPDGPRRNRTALERDRAAEPVG